MRIIKSDACVAEGVVELARHVPQFEHALRLTGPLPLRLKPDGFAELFSAIISQQVSVASARAIWARLCAAGLNSEQAVAAATEDDLRDCGLSRQKIRYGMALADAALDYRSFHDMTSHEVIAQLITVPGIGRWTAEVYTMFSLGHADVFAPGDLALQEAARDLFELPVRPKEKELREMALAWSPWQSVAARILWSYYRVIKEREGIS